MAKAKMQLDAVISDLVKAEVAKATAEQDKKIGKVAKLLAQALGELSPAKKGRKATAKRGRKPGRKPAGSRKSAKAKAAVTAAQIKALRKKLKLSQAEFAKKLGVSIGSITGWERNKTTPRDAQVKKLLALMTGDAPKAAKKPAPKKAASKKAKKAAPKKVRKAAPKKKKAAPKPAAAPVEPEKK